MRGEAVGIDVGGTKTEAILFSQGKVKKRLREATEKTEQGLLDQITRLANKLSQTAPVGISFPGYLYEGVLRESPNLPFLEGKPILQLLHRTLKRPIAFENDANCFAIAEHALGKYRAKNMVGLIIGTGISCGLIINDEPYNGSHNCAGQLGNLPFEGTTLEGYAAGPGIIKRFYAHGGKQEDAATIFSSKSAAARKTVKETITALKRLCHAIQKAYDPAYIVIGGGVSNAPIFRQLGSTVRRNSLGDDAGVIGAALLALKERNNKV